MPSFTTPLVILAGAIHGVESTAVSGCECLSSHGGAVATSPHNTLAGISTYGLGQCQSWDNNANTPYYSSCAAGAANNDYCGGKDDSTGKANWCALPWCYVSKATCPAAHRVRSDVFGSYDMWYTYTGCGVPDCYYGWAQNSYTGQCPYTDTNEVDASKCTACECLGAVTVNVLTAMSNQAYATKIKATGYGSSCNSWDDNAGTPFFDEYCKVDVDQCGADNWCRNNWCYVNPKTCTTAVKTTVMAPTSAAFSYQHCNSPDCYSNPDALGCPHDPQGTLGCEKIQVGNAFGATPVAAATTVLGLAVMEALVQ